MWNVRNQEEEAHWERIGQNHQTIPIQVQAMLVHELVGTNSKLFQSVIQVIRISGAVVLSVIIGVVVYYCIANFKRYNLYIYLSLLVTCGPGTCRDINWQCVQSEWCKITGQKELKNTQYCMITFRKKQAKVTEDTIIIQGQDLLPRAITTTRCNKILIFLIWYCFRINDQPLPIMIGQLRLALESPVSQVLFFWKET